MKIQQDEIKTLQSIINSINPNIKWYEEMETQNEFSDKINLYEYQATRLKNMSAIQNRIISSLRESKPKTELEELYINYEINERELIIADLEVKIAAKTAYVNMYSNIRKVWEESQAQTKVEIETEGEKIVKEAINLLTTDISEEGKQQLRGMLIRYHNSENKNLAYSQIKDFLLQNKN